ncbi:MAG TPA: helix-turn-helix domain-containing protein [Streptosporangiaceae bacterium]|nr:helix-turn-helix domain-containing protein [Streptosporangiaceae bacterium]
MSIGETLAEARHQSGLSVAQVSEQTRIRPPIIRSIEADDYEACGGDFYARGDIRSIAEVVGTDAEPLIHEYDQAHRAPGPVAATSLDELLERSRPQWHRRPGFMLVFGLAAIVIVLGFVGYRIMGSPGSGPALPVAADGNASATPAANGAGGSPAAAGSARATAGSSAPAAARSAQATASPPGPTPAPAPVQEVRAHTMAPASAAAFGSNGTGDHSQDAHLAIDGVRGTAWRTDWYTTAEFGNLYSGTGLLLDMGRPVTVTGIRVTLGPAAGARFQIRVGGQPSLGALRPVARWAGPGGIVRLGLSQPARGRYVLVWFTKLPQDSAGTYRAAIYGIGVKGRP